MALKVEFKKYAYRASELMIIALLFLGSIFRKDLLVNMDLVVRELMKN